MRLPSGDVLYWAHGPLNGVVDAPKRGEFRMRVDDLPLNTFVELSTLMPADALAQAPDDGRMVRDAIVAEQACLGLNPRVVG